MVVVPHRTRYSVLKVGAELSAVACRWRSPDLFEEHGRTATTEDLARNMPAGSHRMAHSGAAARFRLRCVVVQSSEDRD